MQADVDGLNLGLLVLRLLVGLVIAAHGVAKLQAGLGGVANWFESEGLRPGPLHARLAAGTETFGGILLASGLLTPFTALALGANMAVAGFVGHRKNGFFIIRDGWEYTFVLAGASLALAATGPGEWSLDNAVGLDDWSGVGWFVIAAVGAAGAALGFLAAFFRPPTDDGA